jgi:Kef-type K+ transport system membrane component KefB
MICDILFIPMDVALFNFGLIILLAGGIATLVGLLRQPPLLGYIVAGIVVSVFNIGGNIGETLTIFSHLGVAFLLFMIGIELKVTEIREIGVSAFLIGVGQVLFTSVLGGMLGYFLFNYSLIESAYVGIALSFSSTVIIIKLLGEKGDLKALYGRLAVGALIVQDIVAIIALIVLNSIGRVQETGGAENMTFKFFELLIVAILLITLITLMARILVTVLNFVISSAEVLLLVMIAWALFCASLSQKLGFSLEVGAFLAGLSLATSSLNIEIAAKIKPLRDFFIVMFFLVLGSSISLSGFGENISQIGYFSIFILLGNPVVLLIIMGMMGYHRRISFLTGLTVSQISEFSLIMLSTGVSLGHIRPGILTMATGVGAVTLISSSYFINHGEKLYAILGRFLKIFQRKTVNSLVYKPSHKKMSVLLIGAHRMGKNILAEYTRKGIGVLVIDSDPELVIQLFDKKVNAIYGDVSDPELLNEIDISETKVIISTIPNLEDNLFLLDQVKRIFRRRPLIIVRAYNDDQAKLLKSKGANYALVPESVTGEAVVSILNNHGDLAALSKKESS